MKHRKLVALSEANTVLKLASAAVIFWSWCTSVMSQPIASIRVFAVGPSPKNISAQGPDTFLHTEPHIG